MFTGIVAATGTVTAIETHQSSRVLTITTTLDLSDGKRGESIALNGCCLTVIDFVADGFQVEAAQETLAVTTLGRLQKGDGINLERALCLRDRLGGHWVQGHVDGIASLQSRQAYSEGELWRLTLPAELKRYLVKKGSITVDGVSLTVNHVASEGSQPSFDVFLIPHTLDATNFKDRQIGDSLNLEVDILAKYVESLLVK